MKTIIKKTIWLFFITIVVTSCSKDKEYCDPNDEESPCYAGPSAVSPGDKLLLVEWKVNGKIIETYQYNTQNLLTDVRNPETGGGFDLTRDNTGKLIRLDHLAAGGNVHLREEYSYGGTGDKPVSGILYSPNDNNDPLTIRYTYSQNTVTQTFIDEDDGGTVTNTYTFDNKGNLINANLVTTGSIIENGNYDDKNGNLASQPWPWKFSAVNNPQAIKTTSPGWVTDQIYKYTYNQAGYPMKAEVYNRGSDVAVQTHEYFYKKAN
ncbi:hypothetical protein [Sphingobacterium wenxiniae]|uniref:Uncharacterized protein n=1 Tax=Sphingobacterium wenxiniae TaxID=683125 RepID=A0A1I6TK28_9SPHI|nr:hypothetical protein [Sphingobacterium wenxiniae]SFS89612.1 hypothetical protein SAMN05660206_106199 [Sphingobacterium wenxiniae]